MSKSLLQTDTTSADKLHTQKVPTYSKHRLHAGEMETHWHGPMPMLRAEGHEIKQSPTSKANHDVARLARNSTTQQLRCGRRLVTKSIANDALSLHAQSERTNSVEGLTLVAHADLREVLCWHPLLIQRPSNAMKFRKLLKELV